MSTIRPEGVRVLRVDASARSTGSLTRAMGDRFLELWAQAGPEPDVCLRDVGLEPPPAIDEAWIAAAFAGESRSEDQRERLALSNTLIDEVGRADVILICTPMYNYGMPASLKAWFDQVVRVGRTFSFELSRGDRPLRPMLSGKAVVALTASGEFGFDTGGLNEGHGHLLPHLRSCARYLGAASFDSVAIEYQEFRDERHQASKTAAFGALAELGQRVRVRLPSDLSARV